MWPRITIRRVTMRRGHQRRPASTSFSFVNAAICRRYRHSSNDPDASHAMASPKFHQCVVIPGVTAHPIAPKMSQAAPVTRYATAALRRRSIAILHWTSEVMVVRLHGGLEVDTV